MLWHSPFPLNMLLLFFVLFSFVFCGSRGKEKLQDVGATFPNKASLQRVLSIDTTLAIGPFLLLHYFPPAALIASLLISRLQKH